MNHPPIEPDSHEKSPSKGLLKLRAELDALEPDRQRMKKQICSQCGMNRNGIGIPECWSEAGRFVSHNWIDPVEPDRQDRLEEILNNFAQGYTSSLKSESVAPYDNALHTAKAEIENLYVSKEKIKQALPKKHELLGSNDETNYDIGKSNGYNQAIKDISERLEL